jgi:hypothetical protein
MDDNLLYHPLLGLANRRSGGRARVTGCYRISAGSKALDGSLSLHCAAYVLHLDVNVGARPVRNKKGTTGIVWVYTVVSSGWQNGNP